MYLGGVCWISLVMCAIIQAVDNNHLVDQAVKKQENSQNMSQINHVNSDGLYPNVPHQ